MSSQMLETLKENILSLDLNSAINTVNSIIHDSGAALINDTVSAISNTLEIVGKKFQSGEWYLTELVYASEIAKDILKILEPLLSPSSTKSRGTIIVGTVAGDLHDLGKNIFANYAKSAGFNVIDLGTDVTAETFINAIKQHNAHILGMSCLLTATDQQLKIVIDKLNEYHLRNKIKVVVGGAAITEDFAKKIGADSFAPDAITGVDIIKNWAEMFLPDLEK